jgi:MFS transporter, AAHS family, 4-hydroxybenzoate transporter
MFAVTLLNIYLLASWTPTILHASGLAVTDAVVATALQQAGSVTASIVLGPLFDRFGFYRTLVPLFLVTAVAVIIMGNSGSNLLVIDIAAFIAGAGVMGGNSSIVVIAGVFYPTFIRATGVGWGLGLGRVGAILGPLLGSAMVAAHWPPGAIFLTASIPPVVTAALLLILRYVTSRHAAIQTAVARP